MNRQYNYLIVGGGIAADAAVRGIREVDAEGTIGVVSKDTDPPYKRPWLSKALWKGKSVDKVWYNTESRGAELHLGRAVQTLDLAANQVTDDHGDQFSYDKLLLATGVRPRHVAPDSDRIIAYRRLTDFRQLWDLAQNHKRFAVVGNGFIGSELAAALAMNDREVEMIYPGDAICDRLFPADLAEYVSARYRDKKIALHSGVKAGTVTETTDGVTIELLDGNDDPAGQIEADAVVTGIGSELNDELAKAAGLTVDDGIRVDRSLRTSHPNVYAAGDIANFYQSALDKRLRVEHEDNALTMGKAAGRAMAGQSEPWDYLPLFYSDLFDMGYEAVGEIDSRHETVEDWIEPFKQGVAYYLDGKQVRGVLDWNVWDKIPTARKMIGSDLPAKGEGLRAEMLAS